MLNTKLRALDMKSKMRDAFAEPSYIATESPKFLGFVRVLGMTCYANTERKDVFHYD